jgi:hypothetical protein
LHSQHLSRISGAFVAWCNTSSCCRAVNPALASAAGCLHSLALLAQLLPEALLLAG